MRWASITGSPSRACDWVKDRVAFRESIDKILAWDFEHIAMAHGEVIDRDGRARLIEALRERDLY